jgi:hypothetical protein
MVLHRFSCGHFNTATRSSSRSSVVALRERGVPLPREQVLAAPPLRGHLSVARPAKRYPHKAYLEEAARLRDMSEKDRLEALDWWELRLTDKRHTWADHLAHAGIWPSADQSRTA